MRAAALGDDDDAQVLRAAHDPQDEVFPQKVIPRAVIAAAEQDLRYPVAVSKIDDRVGGIIAFHNPGFDAQVFRKVQVPLQQIPILSRQLTLSSRGGTTETAKQSAPR